MRQGIAGILSVLALICTAEPQAHANSLERQESAGARPPASKPAPAPPLRRPPGAGAAHRVIADRVFQLAMETASANQVRAWRDPQTGAVGAISLVKTYQSYDETLCRGKSPCYCREYDANSTVGGRTDAIHGTACRIGEGLWETVSTQ